MPAQAARALLVAALLCFSVPGLCAERILSYHSDISIAVDATMLVTETIRVAAEGRTIRRGIYRDFPTHYRDELGNRYRVDFQVLEVSRDGRPEPWHSKTLSNGVRVYAGSADTMLKPDQYTYTFQYRTNRQIGYFDQHDELYWNVTGNGWTFPIEQVSASVSLPGYVSAGDIKMEGYTGAFGEKGQHYSTSVSAGSGFIGSTRALRSGAGLTLVMSWPKGVVHEPGKLERLLFTLGDNLGLLISLGALLLNMVYFSVVWSRYGRDPAPGVIFPHYEPPRGYSPAAARYISKMGYDNKALTAAVINLAVKGHLSITDVQGNYTLKRLPSTEALAAGESQLLNKLFNRGATLALEDKNHSTIGTARTAHKKALRRDYLKIYFAKNSGLLLPSIAASAIALILVAALREATPLTLGVFALIVITHIVVAILLKSPTGKGRVLMDKLEGFKLYLEVAEKDDLNLRNPPQMTPQLFERFLPFAIALGVEQAWSDQFAQVFADLANKSGESYHPHWYHGEFNRRHMGNFAKSVSSDFSSAISSAATPPGSSSGSGGGGSSGGGGGGGGGGGW